MFLLGKRTYTVTRRGPVSYVAGLPVRPAPTTFEIVASVQPLSGKNLERVPDGLRQRDARKAYVLLDPDPARRLRTAAANGPEADLVSVDGVLFEIHHIDPYDEAAPIPHQRVWMHAAEGTDGAGVGS